MLEKKKEIQAIIKKRELQAVFDSQIKKNNGQGTLMQYAARANKDYMTDREQSESALAKILVEHAEKNEQEF
jgi:hypothetical protein